MKKRWIALALCLVLCLQMVPVGAMAEAITLETPVCDMGCNQDLVGGHTDSCAVKVYYKALFMDHTAAELYAVWNQLPADAQDYILNNVAWNDHAKRAELVSYIDGTATPPTTEPTEPSEPEIETIPGTTPDGKAISVMGYLPGDAAVSVENADAAEELAQFGLSEALFAYDIQVLNGDGTQWQPGEEGVLVTLAVDAPAGTLIGVLHTHEGKTTYLGTAEVSDDQTIMFYAQGFSTFAGFTVDFHYGGVDYSIEGLTSILLSELFTAMGIEEDASQVTSVTFSDPTLVEVTRQENDWLLTSLQAFSTEEILVMTFTDGRTVVIDVTDEQYDYDTTNGESYEVGYWNTQGQANWHLHINRDNLPLTIYLTRPLAGLGWNYPAGSQYISTSESGLKLTVTFASYIPLGNNVVNIDVDVGGRVYVYFFENISVTYSSGNVSASNMPSNTTVKTYGTITLSSSTPTAPGYTFSHWLGSDGKTYSPGATVTVDGDVSFTAQWTPISYSVSFNGNGATGGSMSNQSFTFGTAQNLTANGYERKYTVSFNTNGGNTIADATATATFNGWEDQGSIVYNGTTYTYQQFDAPYFGNNNGDVLASPSFGNGHYNKYGLIKHWITYTVNGTETRQPVPRDGEGPGLYPDQAVVSNMSTTHGYTVPLYANWTLGAVTLPKPERDGHEFLGWYTADGTRVGGAGDPYTPTANTTLTARWSTNSYTVTFHHYLAGTTQKLHEDTTASIEFGKTITVADYKETIPNYDYASSSPATWTVAVSGNEVIIYYKVSNANYTINVYKQNVSGDGYTLTSSTSSGPIGSTATVSSSAYAETGFTFNSGKSMASGTITADGKLVLSLYYDRETYSVTYSYTGTVPSGAPDVPAKQTYRYGTTVTVAEAPVLTGYTFSGWSKTGSFTISGGVTITGSFTAKNDGWYTVHYYRNGTTASVLTSKTVEHLTYGSSHTETAPAIAGYTVSGPDSKSVTAGYDNNVIIFYYTPIEYTVAYDGNGVQGPAGSKYDITQQIPLAGKLSRDGYDFKGWMVKETAGTWTQGTTYAAGTTITAGQYGNVTLVAQWEAIVYKVTYDENGGNYVPDVEYTVTGSFDLATPVRDGYDFLGWTLASDTGSWTAGTYTAGQTIGTGNYGNVTLVAQWQRQTGSLTITKSGETVDEDQTFVFRIQGQGIDMEVVIQGADSVTIQDLPTGTYTVTEDTTWSWRYTPDAGTGTQTASVTDGGTAALTFHNTKTNSNWFNAIAWIKNFFGMSAD